MPDFHLFPNNPYPPQHLPIAHKVWILDCTSCNAFLTNRAMKAVLLLRPNVSLFSSDALPTGCSPYSASSDTGRPAAPHKQPAAPTAGSSSRTCECVTQNLCCHICGTAVGYNIVYPCARCTSSISATNRVTNGHRFVFHSTEVVGTERHYVQDEPGVVPYDPPLFIPPPPPPPPLSMGPYSPHALPPGPPPGSVFRSEYLPTPPLEFATPAYALDASPDYHHRAYTQLYTRVPAAAPHRYPLSPPLSPSGTDTDNDYYGSPPPLLSPTMAFSFTADQKDTEADADSPGRVPSPSLRPGDVVFWHHLARRGEIPRVFDDPRARWSVKKRAEALVFFNR